MNIHEIARFKSMSLEEKNEAIRKLQMAGVYKLDKQGVGNTVDFIIGFSNACEYKNREIARLEKELSKAN